MAKSKYSEKHTVSIEGILNLEDMTIEVEDIGVKDLKDVLSKFNGCNIKFELGSENLE